MMTKLPILALDIATHCGWAMRYTDGNIDSGVWDLGTKCRELALDRALASGPVPQIMVIEKPIVYGHSGSRANGSIVVLPLVGVARRYAQKFGMQYAEIAPSTAKKLATGNGRASKDEVMAAVWRITELLIIDHNQADALAVLFAYEVMHGKVRSWGDRGWR